MRGHVDTVGKSVIGWAFDPDEPDRRLKIRLMRNGILLGEGETGADRPDVEAAFSIRAKPGFDIPLKRKGGLKQIAVQASHHGQWVDLPISQNATRHYQSFNGKSGASRSAEKLAALRLALLRNASREDAEKPLQGLTVLDIGCNEGFFCLEAVKQGAARVVGIDHNAGFIKAASKRCAKAEFICGSWWNLPDAKFDVVLWLSAMHYEPNPQALLTEIKQHLSPNGTLVLECGIAASRGVHWRQIVRADGTKRYPSMDYLTTKLLRGFAPRVIGPSPKQSGDPMRRVVLHCQARRPIVLLVAGTPGAGKTTLASSLDCVPVYHVDELYQRLFGHEDYAAYRIAKILRRHPTDNFANASETVIAQGLVQELAQLIAAEAPLDVPVSAIEGHALELRKIRSQVIANLQRRGAECWLVRRTTR